MRLKAILVLAAASAAFTLPAAAQSYRDVCRDIRGDKQVAGAVLGGVVGGLLGNGVAARNAKDEGAVLGALVGALAGSEIGRGDVNCNAQEFGYGNRDYAYAPTYPDYGGRGYGTYQPHYSYGSSDYEYRNPGSFRRTKSTGRRDTYRHDDLAGGRHRDYRYSDDYAGRECADARRITRLPDGREIHEPVEACRYAYYSDWDVRN
ncbi:glycine zipper 2TM domain-containing protein [bacterium]|nr:glycine zipper 2TM domain-containing protein [bacterium]